MAIKNITNMEDLQKYVESYLESNPGYFEEKEKEHIDVGIYYKNKLDNAKAAAIDKQKTEMLGMLENIYTTLTDRVQFYEDGADAYFKSDIIMRVMMAGIQSGKITCTDALVSNVVSTYTEAQKFYIGQTEDLLATHMVLDTVINGKQPEVEDYDAIIARYKLQNLITCNKLIAKADQCLAEYPDIAIADKYAGITEKSACLTFDNSMLSAKGIDFGNFREKLASGACDKWVSMAFDNVVNSIYTVHELKELKDRNIDPLDGIFLNGRPIDEAIESSPLYDPNVPLEQQRLRCATERILSGNCKVNIARYELNGTSVKLNENVADVEVVPLIKEKFSLIRAIKRFFGFERSTEKNIERISLSNLQNEEVSHNIAMELKEKNLAIKNSKRNFMNGIHNLRADAIESNLGEGKSLSDIGQYWDPERGTNVALLPTLAGPRSISSVAAAYMITCGLTPEQVLNNDPDLVGRKKQMGKEFLDAIAILDKDQYISTKFPDTQMSEAEKNTAYKQYIGTRTNEIADFYATSLMPALSIVGKNIDTFDVNNFDALTDNYDKIKLLSLMAVDIFQSSTTLSMQCSDTAIKQKFEKGVDIAFNAQCIHCIAEHAENVERLSGAANVDGDGIPNAEDEFTGIAASRLVATRAMDCIKANGEGFAIANNSIHAQTLVQLAPTVSHLKSVFVNAIAVCGPQDKAKLLTGCAMIGMGKAPVPAELEGNLNNRINKNLKSIGFEPAMPAFTEDCSERKIAAKIIENSSQANRYTVNKVERRLAERGIRL